MQRTDEDVLIILDEFYPDTLPPSRTAEVAHATGTLHIAELESPKLDCPNVVKIDHSCKKPSFTQ